MPPGPSRVLRFALLAQSCALAFGFQSTGPIGVIPRPASRPASAPVLRVDSSLVLIPVRVTDQDGASVIGLKQEDFEVFDDGVQQAITHFSQDDAPISAGVLLDISGSMRNKMEKASQAATEFFKSANPEDEFFLVEFNARARLTVPFTGDWPGIAFAIAAARPTGMTALLDAIQLSIQQMKHARHARKALVIVSDGGDNFSRRSLRGMRDTLIEAGVQVYSLGVFDRDYSVKHPSEERNGPSLLDRVALETGGRTYPVSLDALPQIGAAIARELRNQYVLGYSPAEAADGKYHRVNLKLALPGAESRLRTYYRQGYYAPSR
ncbi:MAG TPA: VWA domain-containing protein [Bryobacteraceae bacterium]|nr:VWA domain-containing protein [Bryobacteraceae bacterium]